MNKMLCIILMASSMAHAESLKDIVKSRSAEFVSKGMPKASSYHHDSNHFFLSHKYGYPGKPFTITFPGKYNYMIDGAWISEPLWSVSIDWGDGKRNDYNPSSWPFKASHVYLYENSRVQSYAETTFKIVIEMTTQSGRTFTSNVDYTSSVNPNGVAAPNSYDNNIQHSWGNSVPRDFHAR